MSWTKASVDSGQHTYAEALTLLQRAGYTKAELDEFLAYNPGDLYRVPEAFDLSRGGVDPASEGQVARAPITPASPAYVEPTRLPPIYTSAASGGEASLFLSLNGGRAPMPASSQPAREYAALGGSGAPVSLLAASGGATAPLTRIPWVLLIVGAGVIWYLSKGGRG
jgi:hypothetical protein